MLDGDIRLKAARLMTDTDDAGGPMSATEIVSNQIGNLGVVVADLDRTRGDVFMRKLFLHVDAQTTEILYKASLILAAPPADPMTSAVLFDTGDWFDELAGARAWIESYLMRDGECAGVVAWPMAEYDDVIRLLYHPLEVVPFIPAGAVLAVSGGGHTQFVTVSGVESQLISYSEYLAIPGSQLTEYDIRSVLAYGSGYQFLTGNIDGLMLRLVTLTLAQSLNHTFPDRVEFSYDSAGFSWLPPVPQNLTITLTSPRTRLYSTQSGGRYYGVADMMSAGAPDDDQILVSSLTAALAPPDRTRLTGLDASNLPSDGRVTIFRPNDLIVVHHTGAVPINYPVAAGSTHSAGRTDLARIRLVDFDGAEIPPGPATYTANLAAGTIQFAAADALDLTGYVFPLEMLHRIEHESVATDVSMSGGGPQITLSRPLTRTFPLGSYVSSALELGNLYARVSAMFSQAYWNGQWSNERIGNEPDLQFNRYLYSISVTNDSTIEERWALIFSSPTVYRCIGENTGLLAANISIHDTFNPINPFTGQPLFVILPDALSGAQAGNVFRFNTHAASAPVWLALTVLPGSESDIEQDSVELYIRGNSAT
jgi:hypothetical protein